MFQRVGASAYKKDLTNTIDLCNALGNPERKFRTIHVAGTNGKGSTSHMIASILQSAGYKTGLYTSPHLKSFTERIRINGAEISESFVVGFINRILPQIEIIQPSFFEITVAMAFDYFVEQKVDVAVIEVGLGGRLDSTNIITPEVSVITNIGWDHKDILGDTLEKIAFEKAGIIKTNIPAVISERQTGIDDVFVEQARNKNATLFFASDEFDVKRHEHPEGATFDVSQNGKELFHELYLPLQGYYQKKNLCGVLKAVELLQKKNWDITATDIVSGLSRVIENTRLQGRWQVLGRNPLMVCDTAHNSDGLREVVSQIRAQSFEKLHFILGVVRDKDVAALLHILPKEAFYYFCEAKIPRAMKAEELASLARENGFEGKVVADVNDAVNEARKNASEMDMIFIGGSTFVVAEIDQI